MRHRLPIIFAGLALLCFASSSLRANDDTETHQGKLVSVTGNQLTMTMKGSDKQHMHTIAGDALITVDGKVAKTSDLKPGMRIRVTTTKDDLKTATKIEAFSKKRQQS